DVVDERRDPIRATHAAAQLLRKNYEELGDWPLAITAYNHGSLGMQRAQRAKGGYEAIFKEYKSRIFKFASRNFYSEFIAAREIAQNYQHYFGDLHLDAPTANPEVVLTGYASLKDLARHYKVDLAALSELNPALRPAVVRGQKYVPQGFRLRLPSKTHPDGDLLHADLPQALFKSRQKRSQAYTVRKGDTAGKIARMHRVTLADLIAANNLDHRATVYVDQNLRIPVAAEKLPPPSQLESRGYDTSPPTEDLGPRRVEGKPPPGSADIIDLWLARRLPGSTLSSVAAGAKPIQGQAATANSPEIDGAAPTASAAINPAERIQPAQPRVAEDTTSARELPTPAESTAELPAAAASARLPVLAEVVHIEPLQATLLEVRRDKPVEVVWAAAPEDGAGLYPAAVKAPPAQTMEVTRLAVVIANPGEDDPSALPAPLAKTHPTMFSENLRVADFVAEQGQPVGVIRVEAEETLGHYVTWLRVSAEVIRCLNNMGPREVLRLNQRLKIPLHRVSKEKFEQRRWKYHQALAESFFASHRVEEVRTYHIKKGDNIWKLSRQEFDAPLWLIRRYNAQVDFGALVPSQKLFIPVVEKNA
ncbi:MAG: LysM peptidoglycan-binding domain-containing protein, partial [Desulfobacterales bacterium]